MIGPTLSFAVSVAGMAAAVAAFMLIENPRACVAVFIAVSILSGIIARALYQRFTDPETKRRDLEDRVHNPSL